MSVEVKVEQEDFFTDSDDSDSRSEQAGSGTTSTHITTETPSHVVAENCWESHQQPSSRSRSGSGNSSSSDRVSRPIKTEGRAAATRTTQSTVAALESDRQEEQKTPDTSSERSPAEIRPPPTPSSTYTAYNTSSERSPAEIRPPPTVSSTYLLLSSVPSGKGVNSVNVKTLCSVKTQTLPMTDKQLKQLPQPETQQKPKVVYIAQPRTLGGKWPMYSVKTQTLCSSISRNFQSDVQTQTAASLDNAQKQPVVLYTVNVQHKSPLYSGVKKPTCSVKTQTVYSATKSKGIQTSSAKTRCVYTDTISQVYIYTKNRHTHVCLSTFWWCFIF